MAGAKQKGKKGKKGKKVCGYISLFKAVAGASRVGQGFESVGFDGERRVVNKDLIQRRE